MLWAEGAIPLLADEVGTLEDAMNELRAATAVMVTPKQNGSRAQAAPITPTATGSVGERHETRAVAGGEREGIMIQNTNANTNKTAGAVMRELETQAAVTVRQNFGAKVEGLYVPEANRPVTKEMAMARALEANPELYEKYRAAHNAAPMIAALRAAGVEFRER